MLLFSKNKSVAGALWEDKNADMGQINREISGMRQDVCEMRSGIEASQQEMASIAEQLNKRKTWWEAVVVMMMMMMMMMMGGRC